MALVVPVTGLHVGADELHAHAILARAGPHAALVVIACDDHETRHAAAAKAVEQATESWDGSRRDFLAGLDPGPTHDWVRSALGQAS